MTMDDFNYDVYIDETLALAGFNSSELTDDQKYVIMEPSEAPENYMCDGEITPWQAKRNWIQRLKNSGLSVKNIKLAVKLV